MAKTRTKSSAKAAAATNSRPLAPRRADYGKSPDVAFARLSPTLRPIAEALRKLIQTVAPDSVGSLKWGQPVYSIGKRMMTMIGAHNAHVNLIVVGPVKGFKDPKGLLTGSGRGGLHIKLTNAKDIPVADVKSWLQTAVAYARSFGETAAKTHAKAKPSAKAKAKPAIKKAKRAKAASSRTRR